MKKTGFILWDLRNGCQPISEKINKVYDSIDEAKADYKQLNGYEQAIAQLWQICENCSILLQRNNLD